MTPRQARRILREANRPRRRALLSGRLQLGDGAGSYRFTSEGFPIYTPHSFLRDVVKPAIPRTDWDAMLEKMRADSDG